MKLCPFCGSDAHIEQWTDTEKPNATWAVCDGCGVSSRAFYNESKEDAEKEVIKWWDTRHCECKHG